MLATQSKPTQAGAWPAAGVERRPIERLRPSADNTRVAPHGNVVAGLAACDLLPRVQISSAKRHVSLIASSGTSVIAEMTDRVRYGLELYPDYFEVVVRQLFTARGKLLPLLSVVRRTCWNFGLRWLGAGHGK